MLEQHNGYELKVGRVGAQCSAVGGSGGDVEEEERAKKKTFLFVSWSRCAARSVDG